MECSNMGESACLRRSFSHPSDASREPKEGDPIRALGESISFGRFMSESLAWEKWSAFSHNRYQEELEKLSKPGSVAQKKAYFEAHYKRKAAQKAAAELEDTNTMVTTNQVETVESAPLTLNNQVIETTEPQNFVQTAEFVSPVDSHEFMNEEIMVETVTDKVEEVLDQNNSMETDPNIENDNQNEKDDDHRKIAVAEDEKTPAENQAAEKESMSSGGSLKRLRNYSSKLLTRSWSSKPQASPAKQATTSSLQSIHRDGNATPKSKKHVGNIVRNLNTKSVHMSMHFKSFPKEIAKTSPELPQIGRKRTHMSSLAASKEASAPPRKFVSRVAASVNGLLKQPLIKPPFENKRCLKSSNAGGTVSKERPPLICSPFSFRSEERVAKRREFFQRLEEKANSKETVQKQPQTRCQERKKNDVTKLRQTINFEAKATQDSNQGSKLPADQINKIPVTRPRSPKLGKKTASSSTVQNISSLPPKRPSVTSNDSKNVMRKRYESTTQSVTSLGKKMNGCENFSPNIQS
ncbi:protein WVD2-like 7 [Cucurbita pepo subsp. pepo]|uniref:protein WVD2-like 7 n=1 Tax=Cucurbita pepo subsp. pepo TaxID=3664 RepID=UPI000C9D3215|nr:protein WVD2-like 7 [Cucurbita pepo subsp. pepo]